MKDENIDEQFSLFDYGKKGYLTQEEYKAFCYSLLRQPENLKNKQIYKKDINNVLSLPKDYTKYFEFLSCGGKYITFDTMKKSLAKLNMDDEEIKEMITYFNEQGIVSYSEFINIFM